MSDLHLIISDVSDPESLTVLLAGAGDDSSPALLIEAVIRDLGEEDAEFMEVQINGVRSWLP